MPTVVTMPKWGLTMTAGTVTGWNVGEGDEISADAPLLTVETEKAVNDVEAPTDGVLRKIVAEAGAEVPVRGPVAVIAAPGETISDDELAALVVAAAPGAVGASSGAATGAARAPRAGRAAARDDGGRVNASPAARKLAAQLEVDLATVEATGPNGRITSDDVERTSQAPTDQPVGGGADADGIRESMVELTEDLRLFTVEAGAVDRQPPLVFLHGLGGSQTTWSSVLGGLVERYRVVAIDLPGHGQSDKPDPDVFSYSVDGLALAVAAAIEAMGLADVVLVGHSLGGAVAATIALERPELVRGLVLIDGAGLGSEVNPALLDRIEADASPDEARKLLELFYEDAALIRDRGVDEMYRPRLLPGSDAALRAAASINFDRRMQRIAIHGRLAEIGAPTMIVWGERDRIFPVDQAGSAAETIPDTWLEVIEGVGHVPQVEAPSTVVALLDRFVRSLPAAG